MAQGHHVTAEILANSEIQWIFFTYNIFIQVSEWVSD